MNHREKQLEEMREELRRQDEQFAQAMNALASMPATEFVVPQEILEELGPRARTRVEVPHFAISV
jgi:hypothetical protein